ncbi:hypothetical protein WA026_015718 [Henosepilachna vigintioctopunctata]|uniref:Uncharacterized protein n=1 Tax=Henosepilachna vigintioctopunctata TaxID=420089 RepID=A0AAW1V2U9_9CUCU
MGWLDGTPSRAIPPPVVPNIASSGGTCFKIAFSTRLSDLVNLGISRPSEIRASFAFLRIPAVPYCGLCPTPQSHEQSVLRFHLVTVRSYLGHLCSPQSKHRPIHSVHNRIGFISHTPVARPTSFGPTSRGIYSPATSGSGS